MSVDALGIGRRTGEMLLAALDAGDADAAESARVAKKVRIEYGIVERDSA
jgi:LacI family gluconate utilization system Gnt-I transcriptional repressor